MGKIIKITDRAIAEELVRLAFGPEHTLGCYLGDMTDKEFTESRRGKVGGSDMGTIFGGTKNRWLSKKEDPIEEYVKHTDYSVYGKYILEKGPRHPKVTLMRRLRYPDLWTVDHTIDASTQKIFDLGHQNEPRIAQLYAEQTEDTVYEFPWRVLFSGLPDGIKDIDYLCKTPDGEFYVLECKNPQVWSTQKGWQIMAQKGNTDDLTYLVDECYLMQVWFYLTGTNMTYGKIVAGGWSLHEIGYTRINKLPDDAEKQMIDSVNRMIRLMKNPRKTISEMDFPDKKEVLKAYSDTYKYVPLSNAEIELPPSCIPKVEALLKVEDELKEAKKELKKKATELGLSYDVSKWKGTKQEEADAIMSGIVEEMGNHRFARIKMNNGTIRRIRYDYTEKTFFDKDALLEDHPELKDQYSERRKQGRKVTIV